MLFLFSILSVPLSLSYTYLSFSIKSLPLRFLFFQSHFVVEVPKLYDLLYLFRDRYGVWEVVLPILPGSCYPNHFSDSTLIQTSLYEGVIKFTSTIKLHDCFRKTYLKDLSERQNYFSSLCRHYSSQVNVYIEKKEGRWDHFPFFLVTGLLLGRSTDLKSGRGWYYNYLW